MPSVHVVADAVPPLLEAFGRLHPIVLHLPMGLVLGAAAVEALHVVQRRPSLSPFTPVALWLAGIGALAACATGWVFAESEGSGNDLFWHRWLGIAAAVSLCGVAWAATRAARPAVAVRPASVVRLLLLAVTVTVAWVGHLGGNMVWGEGYLLEPLRSAGGAAEDDRGDGGPGADAGAQPAATGDGGERMTFYASKVLPILESRCYECHGRGKHKGGLSLDVRRSVVSKDSHGSWIAKPGDPAGSLIIERCLLPIDDDNAMPPEGERLKAAELDVLRAWIADGVVMPERPSGAGRAEGAAAEPSASVARSGSSASTSDDAAAVRTGGEAALPPLTPEEISDAASMRERGINASPIASGASTFSVSIPGGKGVGDSDLSALMPIAARIEELSLARASVTDAGMMQFPPMPAVRTVRLDNTQLTDVGIIAVLSRTLDAEVVNLVGTKASDGVFVMLSKLPKLRRVYVFDTAITSAGIDRFRAARPRVEIVVGQAVPGTSGAEGPPISP